MPTAVSAASSSLLGVAVQRRCARSGLWIAGRVVALAAHDDDDGEELYLATFVDGSQECLPASEVKLWSRTICKKELVQNAANRHEIGEGPIPCPKIDHEEVHGRRTIPSAPTPALQRHSRGQTQVHEKQVPTKTSGPTPKLKARTYPCPCRLRRCSKHENRLQRSTWTWSDIIQWQRRQLHMCSMFFCLTGSLGVRLLRLAISFPRAMLEFQAGPSWFYPREPGMRWTHTFQADPRWATWQQPILDGPWGYEPSPYFRWWANPGLMDMGTYSAAFTGEGWGMRRWFPGPFVTITLIYILSTRMMSMFRTSTESVSSLVPSFDWLDATQLQIEIGLVSGNAMASTGEWLNLILIGLLKLVLFIVVGVGMFIVFWKLWEMCKMCFDSIGQLWHRDPNIADDGSECETPCSSVQRDNVVRDMPPCCGVGMTTAWSSNAEAPPYAAGRLLQTRDSATQVSPTSCAQSASTPVDSPLPVPCPEVSYVQSVLTFFHVMVGCVSTAFSNFWQTCCTTPYWISNSCKRLFEASNDHSKCEVSCSERALGAQTQAIQQAHPEFQASTATLDQVFSGSRTTQLCSAVVFLAMIPVSVLACVLVIVLAAESAKAFPLDLTSTFTIDEGQTFSFLHHAVGIVHILLQFSSCCWNFLATVSLPAAVMLVVGFLMQRLLPIAVSTMNHFGAWLLELLNLICEKCCHDGQPRRQEMPNAEALSPDLVGQQEIRCSPAPDLASISGVSIEGPLKAPSASQNASTADSTSMKLRRLCSLRRAPAATTFGISSLDHNARESQLQAEPAVAEPAAAASSKSSCVNMMLQQGQVSSLHEQAHHHVSIFALLVTVSGLLLVFAASAINFTNLLASHTHELFHDSYMQNGLGESWVEDHSGSWLKFTTGPLHMAADHVLNILHVVAQLPSLVSAFLGWCSTLPLQSLLTAEAISVWLPGMCLALIVVVGLDLCFESWESWSSVPFCPFKQRDMEHSVSSYATSSVETQEVRPATWDTCDEVNVPLMPAAEIASPADCASFAHDNAAQVLSSQPMQTFDQPVPMPESLQTPAHQLPCVGGHYLAVLPGNMRFSVVMVVAPGNVPGTVIVLPCHRTLRQTFCQAPPEAAVQLQATDLQFGPFRMIAGHLPAFVREHLCQVPHGCSKPPQKVKPAGTSERSHWRMAARLRELASLIVHGKRFKYPSKLQWVKRMGFRDGDWVGQYDEMQKGSLRGVLTKHRGDLWGSVDEILTTQANEASLRKSVEALHVPARGGA